MLVPHMGPTDDELSTLLSMRFDPSPAPEAAFVLASDEGDIEIPPEATKLLIGSGPACEVRLADRELSRRHVSIEIVGDRLHVVDLGSTNGTRVNGVLVRDALLVGGEELLVGST